MFGLGVTELVIILIIVIVVFGATKLPMIGAGLGKGIKNFRQEVKTEKKENPETVKIVTPDEAEKKE